MAKKSVLALLALVLVFSGGCWDYRGLNELAIVAGMSIDKNPESGNYMLVFEVIDISGDIKEQGLQSILIESEGNTLFDATRNARKRILNKLYFGNMQTLVLSEELARNEDIGGIIDWFLRSTEFRETLAVVISQQKTAREIISTEGLIETVSSLEIQKSAKEDNQHTSSTSYVELYNIYSTLKSRGKELTLPAIHITTNDDKEVTELNGSAVFKGERLKGYLTPEESMYYLFAIGEVKGGILTIPSRGDDKDNVSLEIAENKTDKSFSYANGKVTVEIKTDTTVILNEIDEPFDALDIPRIFALEVAAQDKLEQNIGAVVKKVQEEYGSDIFGFGSMISKRDPALWKKLSADWDRLFTELEVKVKPKIRIVNSATVKAS